MLNTPIKSKQYLFEGKWVIIFVSFVELEVEKSGFDKLNSSYDSGSHVIEFNDCVAILLECGEKSDEFN